LNRTQDIHIRVTVEEKRAIAYAATIAGKDMSTWLRSLAASAIAGQEGRPAMLRDMYPHRS
jgi:hypothetical protein